MLAVLGLAMIACGPLDLARDLLGHLATPTSASEFHDSAVWYVATDGVDTNTCTVPSQACRTVQAAIDKADDDDVIEIAAGTYVEHSFTAAAGFFIDGRNITLRGAGSEATFLETDLPGRAIVVIRNSDVSLARLTVQGGRGRTGVGISASENDLRVRDAVVQDNEGFGIMVSGLGMTFEFTNVAIRRNGGGLSSGGVGILRSSQVTANEGIGIHNGGALTVSETTIEGNRAENGPGITNNESGVLTLEQSTIAHNTVTAATFSRALGIFNSGSMTIRNSTVSSNGIVAGGSGGAIVSFGDLTLVYTTVAGNIGFGIVGYGGSITFDNTLITENDGPDCAITAAENRFVGITLDSDETCLRWFNSARATRSLPVGPLAVNGGVTKTHALLPGSPAIDAASGDCPAEDQRGISRPTGTGCDVGAFEFDAVTSATPISQEGTPLPPPVTVTPAAQSLPTITKAGLCWKGPGSLYEVVNSVQAGTQVTLLGRGIEGDWWIIDSPRYPGVACWLPGDALEVDPDLALADLQLFKAPPIPTPTPTPILGCLYQGQNNQAVCYPIAQCPVPFEQSEGACSP